MLTKTKAPNNGAFLCVYFSSFTESDIACERFPHKRSAEDLSEQGMSLEFYGSRRLTRQVIHDPVDALDLVDDAVGNLAQEFPGELC